MLQIKNHAMLGVIAVVGLSACQKSVGSNTPDSNKFTAVDQVCSYTPDSNSFVAADQMASCVSGLSITPLGQMPTRGSATYTGFMAATLAPPSGPDDALIGDASITADFAGKSVTGSVRNIVSTQQGDLGSRLVITGGAIVGNLISGAGISGSLTGYGGQNLGITGTLSGGFSGDAADAITIGTITGGDAAVVYSGSGTGSAEIVVFGLK